MAHNPNIVTADSREGKSLLEPPDLEIPLELLGNGRGWTQRATVESGGWVAFETKRVIIPAKLALEKVRKIDRRIEEPGVVLGMRAKPTLPLDMAPAIYSREM